MRRPSLHLVAALLFFIAPGRSAPAQPDELWHYSPYRVHIWISAEPDPLLPPARLAEIKRSILQGADLVMGAAWDLGPAGERIVSPPGSMATDVWSNLESIDVERLEAAGGELLADDKLYLIGLSRIPGGFLVKVREFDVRTRHLGPLLRREVTQLPRFGSAVFDAVAESFSPVAEITDVRSDAAGGVIRAAGLVGEESPALLSQGDLLVAAARRSVPRRPADAQVYPIPYTYLTVTERSGPRVQFSVASGLRSPLGTRTSRRTEQFAVAVEPQSDATMLRVESTGDDPRPLTGYEIYAKDEADGPSERLGLTGWRGEIAIPPGEQPIRMIYVKHGSLALAKIPVVVGLEATVVASVRDDDLRLEAEGAFVALQSEYMDAVARQNALAAVIRRKIQQGKIEEADELLREFRKIETRGQFISRLRTRRATFSSGDARSQERIDRMHAETRDLFEKFLDPELENELEKELRVARSAE